MLTSSESILRNNPSKTSSMEPKDKPLTPLPSLAEEADALPQLPLSSLGLGGLRQSRFSRTSRASSRACKYPDSSPQFPSISPPLPFRRTANSTASELQQQQQKLAPVPGFPIYRTFADFDSQYTFSIHPQDIGVGKNDDACYGSPSTPRMDEAQDPGEPKAQTEELSPHGSFPVICSAPCKL